MADPVAWLMIEQGWDVIGKDGKKLGHVEEVLGDETSDIFSGLLVRAGLFKGTRYVPAEIADGIYEGEIVLPIDSEEFVRLDESAPGTAA